MVEEFQSFYLQARPRLVEQAYLLSGAIHEAQDLAQETLLRAWRNWDRVSKLDNPDAWARRVLHNLSVSRWRRLRVARSAALPRAEPSDPPVGHLDVAAAISTLPVGRIAGDLKSAVRVESESPGPAGLVVFGSGHHSAIASGLGR